MTYAVCNASSTNKTLYPFQEKLMEISTLPGVYVSGIFDCCRVRISPEMRDDSDGPPPESFESNGNANYIFWFGCQENSGVSANSDIAVEFFRELRRVANPADGSVTLPNDMQYWEPGDSGNILFKIKNPLKLHFDDWEPTAELAPTQRNNDQLNQTNS